MKALVISAGVLEQKEFEHERALEFLQESVRGYITSAFTLYVSRSRSITAYVNDEGMLNGMRPELATVIPHRYVYFGPLVITATDGRGETVGMGQQELEMFCVTSPVPFQFQGHLFVLPQLVVRLPVGLLKVGER